MKTIHDQARERFEFAMCYAEDGAFMSAARVLREIAQLYEDRAKEVYGELYAEVKRQNEAG